MLLLLIIAMSTPVAPTTHAAKKVQISADRVEIIHRSGQVEFSGNVLVVRGSLKLSCTRLTGRYKDSELIELNAIGDVKVDKGNMKATAKRAAYDQNQQTLVLTGQPSLTRNGSRLVGQRISIWLSSERIVVDKPKGVFDLKQLKQIQPQNR
ncbi:MAG: LptA/OstA family protein [Myxococcota bacterium]|nr:LptA/OstA family protein [Myxococcota bacterium]